jgi:hypothetical protein
MGDGSHSNFKAATIEEKPDTRPTISQGLSVERAVRAAPPFTSPLCCFNRLGGLGVLPMYREAWRTVDRRMYTVYSGGIGLDKTGIVEGEGSSSHWMVVSQEPVGE